MSLCPFIPCLRYAIGSIVSSDRLAGQPEPL